MLKKGKRIVKKVMQKLEEKRIADIPKAKEPLIICDFTSPYEMSKWEFINAKGELSQEHAAPGKYSVKITYQPATGASAAKIEKYFSKNKNLTNWEPYEILSFDVFNPYPTQERLILIVKDTNENRAKINLSLSPNTNNHNEIDIGELRSSINPSRIVQLNFCLWDNKSEKILYLDNIKLLPASALGKQNTNILDEKFLPKEGEKIYATGDYFYFDSSKWKKTGIDAKTLIEIPIFILNNYLPNNKIELPFSGGIPFGKGELRSSDNLGLFDNQENAIPYQTKVLSKWPDQSIKWLLLNLQSTVSSPEKQKYFFRYSDNTKKRDANSKLIIKDNAEEIIVNTGASQFSIDKHNFYLFNKLWLDKNNDGKFDDNELISSKGDLVLKHNGKEYHSCLDKDYLLTIEESGPIRACLKAKGWFVSDKGDRFCQFVVRIYAFEGSGILKVQHSFIYTGYPENKYHYLYNGKRLPKNETIEAVYIKTPIKIEDGSKFTFSADSKIIQGELSQNVNFFQNKFNSFSISNNNKELGRGKKIDGWLDLSATQGGVTIGIKNFWQQFPKEFRIDKDNQYLITYLWPEQAGELDLKTTEASTGPDSASRGSAFGLAKTHEVFFYFHNGDYNQSSAKDVAEVLNSDMPVIASPEWISDTKVLGRIWPYDKRLGSAEEFLSRLFDWSNRQIENFAWFGMIDFGDTLSWYRKEDDDNTYGDWGWYPIGRWGWFNCEAVGTHTGALIQFLRTGDYKYFKFGANLSRHIMDIDTCHYNTVANDKRLRGVITDDYSQPGSMHRHNGNHWGDRNEETSHTNVLGLTIYYYITGDERAREVIDEVGSFFQKERIAYFGHPDIVAQRSIANVLWGDAVLYELTGDERYKRAADKWANLLYKGQKGNGGWVDNYNPVKDRWEGKDNLLFMRNYTLPAIIKYHMLTGNKAIAESIIKAANFVIKNDQYVPCFEASAYSYWLTGEKTYLENIKNGLDFVVQHQRESEDPVWNGMIYQKAYYLRVVEFLYHVPFAFEVLTNEGKN